MNILNNIEFNYTYEGLEIEDGWEHNAYTVEITNNGITEKFNWRQGLGIENDPILEDVMECLIMDLNYYDEDIYSLYDEEYQAEKITKELEKQNNKMNNLFSKNELTKIYDYFIDIFWSLLGLPTLSACL